VFSFRTVKGSLAEILEDRDLASLGDAYVNFAYSLVLSDKRRKPVGVRVKGSVLAEALRKAGLRDHLGSRMSRHALADAAEALIVYAWLNGRITLDESVTIMRNGKDAVEGVSELLASVKKRVTFP